MEFHVLDEVLELEGAGLVLLADEADCAALYPGCKIRDSRGNVHVVDSLSLQEDLFSLFIRNGDANYFRRLFRDIFVDATLFTLEAPEDTP